MTSSTGVLGSIVQHPIDRIEFLDANPAVKRVVAVCGEITALCPVTAQPDLYSLQIAYNVVAGRVIESKSLKLFLWRYRDRGISCEDLAGEVATLLAEQYGAPVDVVATQQPRGGIVLEAHAHGTPTQL